MPQLQINQEAKKKLRKDPQPPIVTETVSASVWRVYGPFTKKGVEDQEYNIEKIVIKETLHKHLPDVEDQIRNRDWDWLTTPLGAFFLEVVREFYASYQAAQSAKIYRGLVESHSCLPSVNVRGVPVDVTTEAINSLYWTDHIPPSTEFKEKIADKDNQHS